MGEVAGRAWVRQLPAELARQAALLERLLVTAEPNDAFRALEVQCSLARGNADRYSDIDAGLWLADEARDRASAALGELARQLGDAVDVLITELDGRPYLIAEYGGGLQLDLLAPSASDAKGRAPGAVVLFDKDGLLRAPYEPRQFRASEHDVAEWRFRAWLALGHVDKYVRRGSLWEAIGALGSARAHLLRLHAAERSVPYPAFGLTSILDAGLEPPPGMEYTLPVLDAAAIRRAALAIAQLLEAHDPPPLAESVRARLRA